jgi:hypothetical protein
MAVDISQVNKSESPAECLYAITFTLISGTGITTNILDFSQMRKEKMTATAIRSQNLHLISEFWIRDILV